MTIYIGPISKTTSMGEATGRIRFGGGALGDSFNFDSGVGDLRLYLVLDAVGQVAGGGTTPQIPGAARGTIRMQMAGEGFGSAYGDADMAPLRLGMHAFQGDDAATVEGFMDAGLKLGLFAEELQGSYGFLVDRRAIIVGLSGLEYLFLDADLRIAQAQRGKPTYGVLETVILGAPAITYFAGLSAAMERLELGDRLATIARVLLDEGFDFDASIADQRTAMQRVIDGLVLSGTVNTHAEAMAVVIAGIAFAELARFADQEDVTDGVTFGADAAAVVAAATQLVESLIAEAGADAAATFVAVVSDAFDIGAETGATASLIAALQEGIDFGLHLDLFDGRYTAYVINTESQGLTQYSNYPFNSFAKLGGRYLGMTPDGIRVLEGATDDGAPIAARFRTAMTNLGMGQMKRMVAAYLGYTATGELRLKTITVNENDVKESYHYRLLAQPASAPREARIKIGQGLRSVYWGFEVEAIDGAQFHIDLLSLLPIVTQGRIQGQGGSNR